MNPSSPLPTSDEIDRRLRIVSELRNLCLSLGRARRIEAPGPLASDGADAASAPFISSDGMTPAASLKSARD